MDATVVALALALAGPPSPPHAVLRGPTSEVERLYVAGQDQYEARDYATAARTWTQLLEVLPESEDNRAIRESVLINVLDAHMKAYALLLDHEGEKDIEHLRDATETLTVYFATFKDAHGERVAMSTAVREKADELEAKLRAAEAMVEPERAVPPPPLPPPPKPPLPKSTPREEGTGLIVGGSLLAAAGLACVSMIAIGTTRGRRSLRDYDVAEARLQADPDDMLARADLATAERNGQLANSILIAGAVIAPLLVAGGATMIGLGVRKRRGTRGAVTLDPGLGAFTLRF